MRVEGFLELIGGEKHGHDGHENSEFRAHLGRSSWPLTFALQRHCTFERHFREPYKLSVLDEKLSFSATKTGTTIHALCQTSLPPILKTKA
jgi:hypothetical protein